ncbi:MAG: acyl-CoA dehydrogenase [Myxococcota bacterium]|nr:acyl-CoA dehydrogenase [Myxococcota bacterium]
MSANGYTTDLRDIRFVLHEQLDIVGALAAHEKFEDVDRDLADSMVDESYTLAREVFFPHNQTADLHGCTLNPDGTVTTPEGYHDAWDQMGAGGWIGMTADPAVGGMGLPHAIAAATGEIMTGAGMAFAMYPGLTRAAANLLAEAAPAGLKELVCAKMYGGEWAGTMCLTASGAGSDVGSSVTKARPTDDPGVFLLTGEKIFISCGDHDLAENIVHLVLARTPGAPAGTKGLSIFLVPKFDFDAAGNLTGRNDVKVGKIEHKMGIHGSATCVMVFGADRPARGYLLGNEGDGMRIMFLMMNEARMEVGLQGLCGAAAAYQNALHYARERLQGASIENFGDASAPRVPIVVHPDVRRMLLWQKVHVETMRSLVYRTALRLDLWHACSDPEQARAHKGYVELMTPIVKAYCSDRGYDSTVMALQCFGGYGYTNEYPVEQLVRDTKIASVYEGTNGIQAMDLLGRKMRKGSGILFMNWLTEATEIIEAAKKHEVLAEFIPGVEKARDSLGGSAMHLGGLGMQGNLKGAMLQASPFLDQFGCVALAVEAVEQARVAAEKLAGGAVTEADTRLYRGKILNLRFYVKNILPRAIATGKSIRDGDESCLDEVLFS